MSHNVSNINVRGRLTQVIILVALIAGCVLISQFTQAQDHPKKLRFNSPKYRIAVHANADKAVKIMQKKRTSENKETIVASAGRKEKYKGLAETDGP